MKRTCIICNKQTREAYVYLGKSVVCKRRRCREIFDTLRSARMSARQISSLYQENEQ